MTVNLSLGNPAGTVEESNGAMLVLVDVIGQLEADIVITVATYDGNGKNHNLNHFSLLRY